MNETTEILIAICEDSENDCLLLKDYLHKVALQLNRDIQIWTFQKETDFLERPCPAFDMFFLSLNFPDMNPDKIVAKLKYYNSHAHLVFIAPNLTTPLLGYQYGARNYLVKPVFYRTILNEMEKYLEHEKHLTDAYLLVSNRDGQYKIHHSRLRYIETEKRHLVFHYGRKLIRYANRICDYEDKLPKEIFFRCNNSFIVNMAYISHIVREGSRYDIYLITGEKLPLSRDKYKDLRALLHR